MGFFPWKTRWECPLLEGYEDQRVSIVEVMRREDKLVREGRAPKQQF